MATLDSTGLTIDSYETIKADIETSELVNIDSALNLTASSVIGQLNAIFAAKLAQLEEALQDVYDQMDPDAAAGAALDNIAALAPGIMRTAAEYATLTATVTLTAGTYAAGSLIMCSNADPTLRYANDYEIPSSGGANTGIAFTATETGAKYNRPMADLIAISQPVTGWTEVEATTDATGGLDTETDAAFRLRREQTIRRSGSSHVDAIYADVMEVSGVQSCIVQENTTDTADGIIPAHGIHVVIWDGAAADADDMAVATAIFQSKAAGIATGGDLSEDVPDYEQNVHETWFSRADAVPIDITILGLTVTDAAPASWETYVKTRLLAVVNGGVDMDGVTPVVGFGIGGDVIYSKIYSAVMGISWVADVTSIFLGEGGTSNITIDVTEIAQLDSSDISINEY